ncbi:MAG: asparagine synthase (glutamine-hydrolyzing) [Hyphomicrobiaceae bacterium]
MSGIAGIIRLDSAPVDTQHINDMTAAMACRGPDGINHWVRGSVALGQCMLRTTPESLEEAQPLTNEDKSLVLTMDGRVDNWEELRSDLLSRGARLRTRSDAELVLRAYEIWGRDCVQQIDGDFALVIWDSRKGEAFCARDRLGKKPFYYHWDGKTFVFASEVHAILAMPWVPEDFNEGMVAEFLAEDWHSRDETFWKGIFRLDAAHRMLVNSADKYLERYWTPDPWATLPCTKEDDYVEYYRHLLTDAVRRMSRSYQPVACEVSGGLDSSGIFAVAEELRRQHRLPAPAIDGYTLYFPGVSDANELEYARAVGRHLSRKIEEIPPTKKSLSWYQQWASHYREFPSYPNGVATFDIRRRARDKGSRVLLIGVGGDEWLWGTRNYYADALVAKRWDELLTCIQIDRQEVGLHRSLWWMFRYGLVPLTPNSIKRHLRVLFPADRGAIDKGAWLTPPMKRLLRQRRETYRSSAATEGRQRGRKQTNTLSNPFLAMGREVDERIASSVGIELRQPFLDSNLVQFSFAIPQNYLLRGRTNKSVHRKALTGLLPQSVVTRTTKAEFSILFRRHFSEIEQLLLGKMSETGWDWVEPSEVEKLLDACGKSKMPGPPQWMLWNLFGCEAIASARKRGGNGGNIMP